MYDPWDIISNFASVELAKRAFEQRHNRQMSAQHAFEVSANFIQASEYFTSARGSDRTVKPLLLYYGCVALARGCSIFLRRDRREASLCASHGLRTLEWGKSLAQNDGGVGELRVQVTKNGTLHELAEATNNSTFARIESSGINGQFVHDAISAGQEFTLADVLSRLPELHLQYSRWRSDIRSVRGGVFPQSPVGRIAIYVRRAFVGILVEESVLKHVLEGCDVADITKTDEGWTVQIHVPPNAIATSNMIPGLWDYVPGNSLGIGHLCLVARYANGWFGSKLTSLFILSYMLGMLARYHPSFWTAKMRYIGTDGATPTLISALRVIEEMVPQLIADHLVGADKFATFAQHGAPMMNTAQQQEVSKPTD